MTSGYQQMALKGVVFDTTYKAVTDQTVVRIIPPAWEASTTYTANYWVIPTTANDFFYKVTAGGGGDSGATEPAWPTTDSGTVVDNAITWTCYAAGGDFGITYVNLRKALLADLISHQGAAWVAYAADPVANQCYATADGVPLVVNFTANIKDLRVMASTAAARTFVLVLRN